MATAAERTGKSRPGWIKRLASSGARNWLAFRYRLLSRRYGHMVIEEYEGVPFIVLPDVFNPVLLRTGVFMIDTLIRQSVPPGKSVLDLGTGSGAGAIFAARLGAQVTAVDINPEAVRCARLNTILNCLEDQIEVLQGDLFEPVAGRQFDLILFNPPFYRGTPQNLLDHAWRGHDVFERFAGQLQQHLAPGGRCWLLLSSDGDGDQLLTLLSTSGYQVRSLSERDLLSEILTIYEIRT